jgi:hypothetical protein
VIDALASAYLKIERAREHGRALGDAFEAFLRSNPYKLTSDFDKAASCFVYRCSASDEPPAEWGLIIGDAAQNLRAALDHLYWQLARTEGGGVIDPSQASRVQFPIAVEAGQFRAAHLHPDDAEFVDSLQPYRASDPLRGAVSPVHSHPLASLRALSNIDKHRVLHTAVSIIDAATYGLVPTDVESYDNPSFTFNAFRDDVVVARAHAIASGPKPRLEMVGDFYLSVAFDFSSSDADLSDYSETLNVLDGQDVLDCLAGIADYVEAALGAFSVSFDPARPRKPALESPIEIELSATEALQHDWRRMIRVASGATWMETRVWEPGRGVPPEVRRRD